MGKEAAPSSLLTYHVNFVSPSLETITLTTTLFHKPQREIPVEEQEDASVEFS